ncbi:MAG TPA: hypothetical protein VNZ43_00030 [Sphingomonadaceae bacterium]|nr:hypothetical protein [Sphingomonadaceae bacterium]
MRHLLVSAALAFGLIAGGAAPTLAAPCKDAKGKFIKCPPAKKAPVRCKDIKGKFVKCGMPGAKPI